MLRLLQLANAQNLLKFSDNKKTSESEPAIEDLGDNDEDTSKNTDVRKRRTRKAD